MRLRYAAAALATASLALLAACSSGNGGSGGISPVSSPDQVSGNVTMWIYPIALTGDQAYWNSKAAAFEKAYPKVKVNVVVQPWANRDEQLTTAISGGKAPDVVYLIPDQLPTYAAQGTLADLTSLVAPNKSDFRATALNAMTYNGKVYGVPILMQATTLIVNTKIMKAAGISSPPKTWADVLADAPKLKAAGYYATEIDADPTQTLNTSFYPLLWEAGGQVLSADGKKAAFDSPAGVAALTYAKQLVDGGYVPKDALTTTPQTDTDPINTGKVAFQMFGQVASLVATPQVPLSDWQVEPPLKDKNEISYGTVGGLSVLSGSKNQAAASAWVNWVTSTPQVKSFDESHNYFAPRLSEGSLYAPTTQIGAEEKTLNYMTTGLVNLQARQVMALIVPHFQAALLGQQSIPQALSEAATAVNNLLARSGR